GPPGDLSDRHLLERFVRDRAQEAFAALVARHGPMVRGVCRRVLRHEQDVEDAFQATFLVLAQKAQAVRWQRSLGGYLYKVAYRVACKARVAAARRDARERRAAVMPEVEGVSDLERRELRAVLDEELSRLPEVYRTPLVLCYFQGKTNEAAAEEL